MTKQFEYKSHKYWITVEPAIIEHTNKTVFIAFINDEKPSVFLWGSVVKGHNGLPLLCKDEFKAVMNANAIKQNKINSKSA